jgi:hypothetical protein
MLKDGKPRLVNQLLSELGFSRNMLRLDLKRKKAARALFLFHIFSRPHEENQNAT